MKLYQLIEKAFENVRLLTEKDWQYIVKQLNPDKSDYGIEIGAVVPFDDNIMYIRWWKHTSKIVNMDFVDNYEAKTTIVRRNLLFAG